MGDRVDESPDWKQKYLTALDEFEAKERAWEQEQGLLRLAVSRLTLVADSSDSLLVREVEAIRDAVRGELRLADLNTQLERLGETIRRLDQVRSEKSRQREPYEALSDLLDRLAVPRGLRRKAKTLRARLLQTPSEEEIPARVEEFAAFIEEIIEWVSEEPAAQTGSAGASLLSRLMGQRKGTETAPADGPRSEPDMGAGAAEVGRTVAEMMTDWFDGRASEEAGASQALATAAQDGSLRRVVDLGLHHAERLGRASRSGGETDESAAARVLETLIDSIPLPGELDERAGELRSRVVGCGSDQVDGLVKGLAELVTEAQRRIQAEKAALEGFLQQLTERLRDLDSHVLATETSRREAQRRRSDVTDRLDAEVRTMGSSVREARDLDTLKSGIQARLDTIQQHIDKSRQIEAERERHADDEIRQLTSRLESLEQETTELRDRVQQERSLALRDPLTGLPNRLAFDERMAQEFARWKRYGRPLVISIWDIDRFKRINDNYGHKAGDRVLKILAELMSEQVRETDFMARYGGEEFVLLMPETPLEGALQVAEKLRGAVQGCDTHFHGQPVELTVSCGLTLLREDDSSEVALERADQALYRAKGQGRNRCVST